MEKILIADDHPLIQKGLSYLLMYHFPGIYLQSAYDGQEVFDTILTQEFDLLILDVNMPFMSFSDFEQIILSYPQLKVLILTQFADDHIASRYLKKGAYGFMSKNTSDDKLMAVINSILKGNKSISPAVMNHMVNDRTGRSMENPLEKLSSREYDIVVNIAKGLTLTEIAEQMHISLSAVSTYKNRALKKLNVKSLAGLIDLCNEYVK